MVDYWNELDRKSKENYSEQQKIVWRRTNQLFAWLLIGEWLSAIIVGLVLSPHAWSGSSVTVHPHIWSALFLGGAVVGLPVYLASKKPEATLTRHTVAVAQMLMCALLIHLTGGRIETHFMVFGSLAFLSFYRDWRVLLTASGVSIFDHVARGIFFPQSVYGVANLEPLRWVEHSWWLLFEVVVLIKVCNDNNFEVRKTSHRQAELEQTRNHIEKIVRCRTQELEKSKERISTLYAVSRFLSTSKCLADATPKIMRALRKGLRESTGYCCGRIWEKCATRQSDRPTVVLEFSLTNGERIDWEFAEKYRGCVERTITGGVIQLIQLPEPVKTGVGTTGEARLLVCFPIVVADKIIGAAEMYFQKKFLLENEELSLLESVGRQLGDFIVGRKAEAENVRLAQVVHSSTDAIVSKSLEGEILSWNCGAQKIFGYSSDEVEGRVASFLFRPADVECFESEIAPGGGSQSVTEQEVVRLRKDGSEVPISLSRSRVFDQSGNHVGFSVIMRDITERKEAEKRVGEFYSIVSHELRTPLTSVRGALGLIEGGVVENGSEECLDLIAVARESADRLIRLINDMLDLKKLESGKMELFLAPLDPVVCVETVIDELGAMASEAGISLLKAVNTKQRFLGDNDRVTQVLINLVSNAIKFSPAGTTVMIGVRGDLPGQVRFEVVDQGSGIPAHQSHKLFGKFQQLDSSDTRQKGGSGLGLSICKALIEQHGGEIGCDSVVGHGSTFWFTLPATSGALAVPPALLFEPQKLGEFSMENA